MYVDAGTGSDGNAGTQAAPFQTIAYGLSQAFDDVVVHVAPGTYSEGYLTVGKGVTLLGDTATKGSTTTITALSSQLWTIQALDGAVIEGFTFDAPGATGTVAVNVDGQSVQLNYNTIVGAGTANGGVGIALDKATGVTGVYGNVISDCYVGVGVLQSGSPSASLGSNTLTGNAYGAECFTNTDFGGGTNGSVGGNVLSCNSQIDLYVVGNAACSAVFDAWDHSPPTTGSSAGDDVSIAGGGTIIFLNSQVVPSPCH